MQQKVLKLVRFRALPYSNMARLYLIWSVVLLMTINRLYADPICTRGLSATGPNIVCTAGNNDNILRRRLVSDNNRTTEIILTSCRITRVEVGAFNALPSLENLDMSHNTIAILTVSFKETPNMKKLNLSDNKLEGIKANIFNPLTKLKSLDFSNNLILGSTIEAQTFKNNHLIEDLDFSGNLMTGTQENLLQALQMIKTLNLDRCSLKEIPTFATRTNLNTMTSLSLSLNQISRLHNSTIFNNLVNLENLSLDGNLIDFIHEDVFKPLKNIKSLALQNNKVTRLPETLFINLSKLGNINLSHNLIEYVPVNAFRNTKLKNLNLADNRFTYLQDNFCLELRNSGVRLKKFFFNQNPWQCSCLNEILKEMKKMCIEYNGLKYRGREPVCVTTKEFLCKRHKNFNDEYLEMYNDITHN